MPWSAEACRFWYEAFLYMSERAETEERSAFWRKQSDLWKERLAVAVPMYDGVMPPRAAHWRDWVAA